MVLGVNSVMWNEVISVVNIVSIIDTHNAPPHMDEATGTSELGTQNGCRRAVFPFETF